MPLTRLDNLISSKTGKYLYVSPDDFNATDALSNRGNSPVTPFKSIQRAFLEIARYSYLPGFQNDRFDQFSIMLMPGIHYIDNRPGLVDTTGIDVFGFDQANNEWTDNSILDISNPDNVLYKFNNTEGGAIIPRGSSLVGYDLRRTVVRPLYVPDPASVTVPRSAIFNVTGGCYFWQFTIKDGQTTAESPLYNQIDATGEVYYDPNDFTKKTAPNYSHHKLTVFEYADTEELGLFYRKIAKGFSAYQPTIDDPGEFDFRVQENRIVGPLSDSRVIESLTLNDATTIPSIPASTSEIEVTTKVDHGYFAGQFVAISGTEIDSVLEGIFPIKDIDQNDPRKFTYEVAEVVSAIGTGIASGQTVSVDTTPALGQNAQTLAEVDSVESASPYVFNCSIRSTWGICGIWANGLKATGFKSMVIAQYTGVSLQKDDRAFIRYDEYSNTWNQASLVDAFATVPYHAKGDSYWKDDWRNFHVRASEDAFIQNVSIFAVGFADHFLMESGGDMSITNSNSNFGNTSLHAIGFKGFAFNQDKGGYLTDIIPPKVVETGAANVKRTQYYTIDIQGTIQDPSNYTKLFLGSEDITTPINRPAVTINGYRVGAKGGERLYVKLDPAVAGGTEEFNVQLEPTGFVKYIAAPSILNPSGAAINSIYADAANLIESNRKMIQEEVFGYILEKYPRLQNISYVNPGRDPQANRYFDARNLINMNRQEIINSTLVSLSQFSSTAQIASTDIGDMVDAIAEDLRDGGNYNTITLLQTYFAGDGTQSRYSGQNEDLIWAMSRARDLCKKAIANLLSVKADLYDPDPNSPFAGYANLPIGSITAGRTGSDNGAASYFTPTGATYDPATGDFVLTANGHGLNTSQRIKLLPESFVFTCDMDNNKTEHALPSDGQDAYSNSLEITDVTTNTITVNVGASGPNQQWTPSAADYDPASGNLILTIGSHTLSVGEGIVIDDNSLTFTCTMDGDDSQKTYPRPGIDPYAGRSMKITAISANTITVNAGASRTNQYFTPSAATYDPSTGDMTVTVGQHGLGVGRSVVLEDNSFTFTCALDNNATEHTYPRPGTDPYAGKSIAITSVSQTSHTIADAPYNPATGVVTFTVTGHGFANGDYVKIDDGGLTYTCDLDGNTVQKSYPRAGYDYPSGRWLQISNVTSNTFEINVGSSSYLGAHTFVSAVPGALKRQTGEFTINVGTSSDTSAHTFVSASANAIKHEPQSAHTFVSATANAVKHLPQSTHNFVRTSTNSVAVLNSNGASGYGVTIDGAMRLDPASRYRDTYNLIESNKDYILDNALAEIAVYHADFYIPPDPQEYDQSRFKTAYRFIRRNKEGAQSYAIGQIQTTYPTFQFPGNDSSKCFRDLGFFIDALGMDIFMGGNLWTRTFISKYFDANSWVVGGLQGEELQSIAGFNAVRDYMQDAVSNQLTSGYQDLNASPGEAIYGDGNGDLTNLDPAACTDVQNTIATLTSIVTQVISDGNPESINNPANPNYVTPTERDLTSGETKCRRDIGHIVDAVQQDLWFGGNAYSIAAARAYFNRNGLPITNGLVGEEAPSITAFKRAADALNLAINNQLYYWDQTITLDTVGDPAIVSDMNADAHDLVLKNKEYIAKEAYLRMQAAYPSYVPQSTNTEQDCLDDVYNVLEEIMYDVKFGGNAKTYDAAEIYTTNVMPYFGPSKQRKDFTPTTVSYDPATGLSVFTIPGHDMAVGGYIRVDLNSVVFTCTMDGNQTQHASPSPDDPYAGQWMQITAITASTVTVNVGASQANQFWTPTNATYNSTTGDMELTIGSHSLSVSEGIVIADNSLTFTCAQDGNQTQHTYPRPGSDPFAGRSIPITATTATTITVNVGAAGTAAGVAHTFVSAAADAVKHLPQSDHTFVSAQTDCVHYGVAAETFIDPERDEAAEVFTQVKNLIPSILRNELINSSAGNSFIQFVDNTIVDDWDDPACVSAISATQSNLDTIIQAIGTDNGGVGTLTGITRTAPVQPANLVQNGVNQGYVAGNCSDVVSSINSLINIITDAVSAGTLDTLPSLSNGEWDCANVRSTIETLFDITLDAFRTASLAELPVLNRGGFTTNATVSKCYRDVSYIVDAVVSDLRLGGNINSVQAGEAYYVGNQLEYIDGEKTETIDAWNYVGQMATAAMRNFDVLAQNCSTTQGSAIVDINDTRGILIGMLVREFDNSDPVNPAYEYGLLQSGATEINTNIPLNTYVKRIISSSQIELGVDNSRFDTGSTVSAQQTSSTVSLYFSFPKGQWADTLPKTVVVGPASANPDVLVDTTVTANNRECSGTADAIETLVGNITTIINSGVGSVARQPQTTSLAAFVNRATVFTINTSGVGASNPHNFETGTPVRLVPRPRFDVAKGKYVDVDKRLVRLPNGFETNRTYYVIAPGRRTQPEDYSGTTFFNGSDQTKLMLATSRENAAAGIYIYASESESIDPNVEIDIYQFILDEKYDLHNYKAKLTNAVFGGIETDVSHIFDVPFSSVTPQKVFFRDLDSGRIPIVSSTYDADPDVAVQDTNDANDGRINPTIEFYARYQNDNVITVHKTHSDAINNVDPISFTSGQTQTFQIFANKRRTPFGYDPSFSNGITTTGKWFVRCVDEGSSSIPQSTREENIFWRLKRSDYADRPRSTDMWFTRLEDEREANDRTYKLRYVIPKYLENARDPINGFVIKTRTDDTRKLVPQKVLLKPVAGTVYGARFENPVQAGEYIGFNQAEFDAQSLNKTNQYDPYRKVANSGVEYRAFAKFTSGIQATIQSGRYVQDDLDPNINYLELTLYDHGVDTLNFPGLRNESFTTVKINAPQGGEWVVNKTASITANQVEWSGNSSGIANIHAYYTVGGEHYLIIKNVRGGKLEFSEYYNTRFRQGSVFADMLEDQDMGKSLPLKTLIRKNYPQYFYKQNGANVYTITPGDRIQDDAGIEYYVDTVEDAGVIEDTFYVFSYETLQRRIAGQQDGIYYLSCLRGNVSPFPTGAGVAENFKKFRFSQPVSSLYPLDYKNDPLWFQKNGTTPEELNVAAQLLDPPSTFSAADNYIHGLVTTNDFKNSVTRELVDDLIEQPAFAENDYITNAIQAQSGNATSGSEDRRIPIAGDSTVLSDQRYYVELRRPSIARAGNHTFEYLGFGPGNYSTGLPARQEIVLTPTEDFYAQSKKQDAGIVFYTGLNSNGDLYIGNRKINAITGEETFLESATLRGSEDDDEDIGNLVTSFDTPVTFNQNITVVGGDGSQQNVFQSPLIISVQDNDLTEVRDALIIRSNVSSVDPVTTEEQDESLDRTAYGGGGGNPTDGDIRISKNRINAAIFSFNPRGKGQDYEFKTHITNGVPSNITPNNTNLVASGGTRLLSNQFVDFGGVAAKAGDVLYKGKQIGKSGSLGWIYSNYFTQIPNNNIFTIEFDGTNVVKLTFKDSLSVDIPNSAIGITSGSQIRFNSYPNPVLNNTWTVFSPNGDAFDPANNYVHFQINTNITVELLSWNGAGGVISGAPNATVEFSNSNWKEQGVIGAEAIRTETETIGDYKLGINTIARSDHAASQNAFTSVETEPRANLDVVGNSFISGKKILSYLTETGTIHAETNQDNALIVGGDSTDPDEYSTLRVMTTNSGRVGVNTAVNDTVNPINNLDRNFVVIGNSRFSDDANFQADIEVNGGDITTTNNAFNFVNQNAQILNFAGDGQIFNMMNNSTVDQSIALGNTTTRQTILIGEAVQTGVLKIHRNSTNATVDIATVSNDATSECRITLGGAWATQADATSFTKIGTFYTGVAGNLEIGTGYGAGTSSCRLYAQTRTVNLFDGDQTNTVNLATNATTFTLGSTGGTTFIRNTLNVLASTIVEGNIRLDGGLNAGIIKIGRGKFGTTRSPHLVGGVENPNIDFYKYESTGKVIDTAGVSQWGSTAFLVAGGQIAAIDNITNNNANQRTPGTYSFLTATSSGAGTGATFTIIVRFDFTIDISIESPGEGYADNETLTITDSQLGGGGGGDLTFQVNGTNSAGSAYYLPISQPTVGDFNVGDLLFLDRANASSPDTIGTGGNVITGLRDEARSEILRITGIANIANPSDPNGYRLIVTRGAEGTGTYQDHPDGCVIAKFVKQGNASYITGSDLDNNGVLDEPLTGIGSGAADVNIGVAEFGGTISTLDYIRLSQTEFVSIVELISTSPQSLVVNDGGSPAADVFKVESTTGDTYIFGDIAAGSGFNKFTVDSATGNTNIAGTLTTENTLTINGSRQLNTEFFRITDGGNANNPARTTLEVDTATGDLDIYGGNFNIWSADGTVNRFEIDNSSGDATISGSFSAYGSGASKFGGPIIIGQAFNAPNPDPNNPGWVYNEDADLTINGGDLTINQAGNTIFSVENDGAVNIAGISNYFSQTGGRRWDYSADAVVQTASNVNYFINSTGNTLIKLPQNALMGDTIRIIDIGGALTYNISLVVRAADGDVVQGEGSNTGTAMLSGIAPSNLAGYNGGELVVQTPFASFGLVYAGSVTPDGAQGVPTSKTGWYLMDV